MFDKRLPMVEYQCNIKECLRKGQNQLICNKHYGLRTEIGLCWKHNDEQQKDMTIRLVRLLCLLLLRKKERVKGVCYATLTITIAAFAAE